MANPTLNAFAQQVMEEMGESASNSSLVTQYERWIQDALDELSSHGDFVWPFFRKKSSITTAASTAVYALDADVAEVTSMRLPADEQPIEYCPVERLIDQGRDLEQEGTPRVWFYADFDSSADKQQIQLWPVPSSVQSVEYWFQVQLGELSSGAKIPVPREVLHILKYRVKALAYENEDNFDAADRELLQARQRLERLVSRYTNQANRRLRLIETDVPRGHGFRFVRFPSNVG